MNQVTNSWCSAVIRIDVHRAELEHRERLAHPGRPAPAGRRPGPATSASPARRWSGKPGRARQGAPGCRRCPSTRLTASRTRLVLRGRQSSSNSGSAGRGPSGPIALLAVVDVHLQDEARQHFGAEAIGELAADQGFEAGHGVLVGLSDLRHDHREHAVLHEPAHDVGLTGAGAQRGHHASPRRAARNPGIERGILLPLPALRMVPAPAASDASSCSSTSNRTKGCENRSARFHSLSRTSLKSSSLMTRRARSADWRPRAARPSRRAEAARRELRVRRARDRPRGRTASTREIGGAVVRERATQRHQARRQHRGPTLIEYAVHLSSSAPAAGARDERARRGRHCRVVVRQSRD